MFIIKKIKLIRSLSKLLSEKAGNFNGLYNALDGIINGENKKSAKTLNEFYNRIALIDGYDKLSEELRSDFPATELTQKKLKDLSQIVNKAFENVSITHSTKDKLIKLTEKTVLDYQNWGSDEELCVDCKAKIVLPAWYKDGALIEKGYCTVEK